MTDMDNSQVVGVLIKVKDNDGNFRNIFINQALFIEKKLL